LLGDVVDVAIRDYKTSLDVFKLFLNQIIKDGVAEKILYVPGNHDFEIWHTIEYQANIINPIINRPGKQTSLFRMAVPAVLDDRPSAKYKFFLGNVTRRPEPEEPYGHMFLDFLCDEKLRFSVAFPNAYLVTDMNECVMMTHGQYLQTFWSLISDWAPAVFHMELNVNQPLTAKNLVALNFPLSQLSSSGVGQAGPLTDVIRQIQYDFKKGKPEKLEVYLDNLRKGLCTRLLKTKWYNPIDWVKKCALGAVKKSIIKGIMAPHPSPRENGGWEYEPETLRRMSAYYLSGCDEIERLNSEYEMNLPPRPSKLIFGHSHRPIALKSTAHPVLKPFGRDLVQVPVFNTGGWLENDNGGQGGFCGAELFLYETGKGLRSETIS
jgi:hypothetical protein